MTTTSRTRASLGASLTGWSTRGILGVVLLVSVLFFGVPLLWLILATTKSGRALSLNNPFSVGSWHDFTVNWDQLFSFQDGAVGTWVTNSAIYSVGALVITLVISIPAGYALALTEFRLPARTPRRHARCHADTQHRARPPGLP